MNVAAFYTGSNDRETPTFRLLDKFLDGMRRANADISFFNISNLDIKPCKECTVDLLYDHVDYCRCDDDMNSLYPIFRKADIWIFAAPLNLNGTAEYLKNILDRMEPLFQPIFLADSGSGDFPPDLKSTGKIAFIGSYPSEFDKSASNVIELFESLSILFSKDFTGLALRTGTELNDSEFDGLAINVENAGYELALDGKISPGTYEFLKNTLFTRNEALSSLNKN